jgi:hypothetical protein
VEKTPPLRIGGALRLNYVFADWSLGSRQRGGDFAFDTFFIDVDADYDGWLLSAQYRFYAGFQALHHGWIGRRFSDELEVRLGITRVPFGLLPFASHNWFFQLPYYVGLEDDHDAGLAVRWQPGRVRFDLAFFKNDEGSFIGKSADSARYAYDVVNEQPSELVELDTGNAETNQLNGRVAWFLVGGELQAELGVSGQIGQLYDAGEGRFGHRWAAAGHLDAHWRGWNLKAELAAYGFEPVRDPASVISMGAYDAPYFVAKRGTLYVAGLSWELPVRLPLIDAITVYEDFSLLDKRVEEFRDSVQNVAGALIEAGPILTYVDLATGRNHPFIGPNYATALARGDEQWHTRFNVNVGYYF